MFKKLLVYASVIALTVASVTPFVATAATVEDDVIEVTEASTVGRERASWGQVILTSTKKTAYATTKTYAGTAVYLYVEISSNISSSRGENEREYASSVISPSLSNPNSVSVTWTGFGEIQDTHVSGSQYATATKSY